MTRGTLYVEGPDDEHSVRHLLLRRGFESSRLPEFRVTEGMDAMLAAMDVAIRAGTGTSIAFLLDANDNPAGRWQALRSRLIGDEPGEIGRVQVLGPTSAKEPIHSVRAELLAEAQQRSVGLLALEAVRHIAARPRSSLIRLAPAVS